jgi:thiol-disulfide isomerase/thioredoxin
VAYLKTSWRSHLVTLLVALAAMLAVNAWQTRHVPSAPAPDFQTIALLGPGGVPVAGVAHGTMLSLAQWRAAHPGRAVAIHIWSDWCPFCKAEEGSVTRVAADWPVLTVASRSGEAAQVARFMSQRQLPWVASLDPKGEVSKAFGLGVVPAWVVLDASGQISSVATGYTTELGMRARLWWASL